MMCRRLTAPEMVVLLSPAACASLARKGWGRASHDDSGVVLIHRSWISGVRRPIARTAAVDTRPGALPPVDDARRCGSPAMENVAPLQRLVAARSSRDRPNPGQVTTSRHHVAGSHD